MLVLRNEIKYGSTHYDPDHGLDPKRYGLETCFRGARDNDLRSNVWPQMTGDMTSHALTNHSSLTVRPIRHGKIEGKIVPMRALLAGWTLEHLQISTGHVPNVCEGLGVLSMGPAIGLPRSQPIWHQPERLFQHLGNGRPLCTPKAMSTRWKAL